MLGMTLKIVQWANIEIKIISLLLLEIVECLMILRYKNTHLMSMAMFHLNSIQVACVRHHLYPCVCTVLVFCNAMQLTKANRGIIMLLGIVLIRLILPKDHWDSGMCH